MENGWIPYNLAFTQWHQPGKTNIINHAYIILTYVHPLQTVHVLPDKDK